MRAYARQLTPPPADRDRMIAEHVENARRIALHIGRRVPDWISRDDLVSAALLGLAEAAERYDASRGEPFIAFAAKRIRGAVLDELRRGDFMPRRVRQTARKVGRTIRALEHSLGRPPEDTEVAAALEVSVEEYRADLENLVHLSISGIEQEDLVEDETSGSPAALCERRELVTKVRTALSHLDKRDALLLSLYYDEELTYVEIGEVLGVSTSRVCQLHGRAIARVRAELETPGPNELT